MTKYTPPYLLTLIGGAAGKEGSSDKADNEEDVDKVKPPCSYERRARPWEWLPCDLTRPETKEATSKTRHYSHSLVAWNGFQPLALTLVEAARALELEADSPVPTPPCVPLTARV